MSINVIRAKPDLRVFLKRMIYRSGSVLAAVIWSTDEWSTTDD